MQISQTEPSSLKLPASLGSSWLDRLCETLDPDTYRRKFSIDDLWIKTKPVKRTDGTIEPSRIIPFVLNGVQEQYLDELQPDWRTVGVKLAGLRENILKARQFGFSTLIEALLFLDTINTPNTRTVVIAHDTESTEELFGMIDVFYDYLPDPKPEKGSSSKRKITWPSLRSSFSVLTAGVKTSGRSKTINNLHASETAFWEHPEVATGLYQAVPEYGCIFQESTANGEGNTHHSDYKEAIAKANGYNARFFAWFQHDEYQTPTEPGFVKTDEEVVLAERYNLTDAQLQWRRNKKREPGMGNMFAQEYPANWEEAFSVSGSKFFTDFNEEKHTCPDRDIPRHWNMFGGLDFGTSAPFSFHLMASDERGRVQVFGECYEAGLLPEAQAVRICDLLRRKGLFERRSSILIAADPSMFPPVDPAKRLGEYPIEAFWRAGLQCVKANNDRNSERGGWVRFKEYLVLPEGDFKIHKGSCPNLIRTIPIQVHDKTNTEDLDTDLEDHACDSSRYGLMTRPRPSEAAEFGPQYQQVRPDGSVIQFPTRLPAALTQVETNEDDWYAQGEGG